MKYRRLGNTGLLISATGLGTNNFGGRMDAAATADVLNACLDAGVNFVDTSDTYTSGVSEEYIGRAITGHRDEFVLTTKVGMRFEEGPNETGLSAAHIKRSIEGSLRRLGTDYVDLYQVHIVDPLTPIEETLRALDDLVTAGKVRYIGCSNYMAWEMVEAIQVSRRHGWAEFVSNQPEYSMLVRDADHELIHACSKYGAGILPYYPLAGGFLNGKYRRGETMPGEERLTTGPQAMRDRRLTDANFHVLDGLEGFARERGHSLLELAFAWLLGHPEVSSVIAGASNPDQLRQNAAACEWELTGDEMRELNEMLPNNPGRGVGSLAQRRSA